MIAAAFQTSHRQFGLVRIAFRNTHRERMQADSSAFVSACKQTQKIAPQTRTDRHISLIVEPVADSIQISFELCLTWFYANDASFRGWIVSASSHAFASDRAIPRTVHRAHRSTTQITGPSQQQANSSPG
jgi:hypothetical protein